MFHFSQQRKAKLSSHRVENFQKVNSHTLQKRRHLCVGNL